MGVEKFKSEVEKEFGKSLAEEAVKDEITMDKRDHLGVYPQKQEGYSYVGIHIPMGRLTADLIFEMASIS